MTHPSATQGSDKPGTKGSLCCAGEGFGNPCWSVCANIDPQPYLAQCGISDTLRQGMEPYESQKKVMYCVRIKQATTALSTDCHTQDCHIYINRPVILLCSVETHAGGCMQTLTLNPDTLPATATVNPTARTSSSQQASDCAQKDAWDS